MAVCISSSILLFNGGRFLLSFQSFCLLCNGFVEFLDIGANILTFSDKEADAKVIY